MAAQCSCPCIKQQREHQREHFFQIHFGNAPPNTDLTFDMNQIAMTLGTFVTSSTFPAWRGSEQAKPEKG